MCVAEREREREREKEIGIHKRFKYLFPRHPYKEERSRKSAFSIWVKPHTLARYAKKSKAIYLIKLEYYLTTISRAFMTCSVDDLPVLLVPLTILHAA